MARKIADGLRVIYNEGQTINRVLSVMKIKEVSVQGQIADLTLRYTLRATQDEIDKGKRILSSGSYREPRIEGRFPCPLNSY